MANLSIAIDSVPTAATLTDIGGAGTPQSPREWRVTSSKPLFAQSSLLSYTRKVKDKDQIVHKYKVPYTVTDPVTAEERPISFVETTVTHTMPRDVPATVVDKLIYMVATAEGYLGTASNLLGPTAARQAY